MSTLWFYAQDQQQHGPLPSEEMRTLLSSGRITKSTMVWSEGMELWVAAGKVTELVGVVPPPLRPTISAPNPASQPVVGVDSAGAEPSPFRSASQSGPRPTQSADGGQVQVRSRRAWNRFFSRAIDWAIGTLLVELVFGSPAANSALVYLLTSMTLVALVPLEAWFLSRWGMTPGKWVFRVRVVHADNRLMTFQEALQRSFKVLVSGMGFGLPLLQVLFNVLGYKEYIDTGTTSWDRSCRTEIQHAPMRPIHLGIAIGFGLLVLLSVFAVLGEGV